MSDQILEPPGSHEPTEHAKTPKKAAASGWIGSALEYYDFFIYAQAAALVFPNIFFPSDNPQVAIVASFATFGVGYVARPIGAFVLGHWGDTHGRKTVLVLCMLLMGGSTFLVALLPTYAVAGVWAPILLVALRLIQGFAVGGEISGASAMILEHSPFGRRGYFASFTLQGVQAGQIIAAAVFLPLSAAMSPEAFQSWGWRIPFLLSALVVVAGYIIRRKVDETPAFQEESEHGEVPEAPIVQAVRENGSDMLRVICMALMNAIPTAVTVFGATFATNAGYGVGLTTTNYLWISVIGNVVAVVLIPFVGNLTDPIGRRPAIIVGALGSGSWPTRTCTSSARATSPMAFLFAILMWGIVYQGYNAVFPAFYQELFPTKTRVTGVRGLAEHRHPDHRVPAGDLRRAGRPDAGSLCRQQEVRPRRGAARAARTAGRWRTRSRADVVWTVGSITFGLAIIAAIAAFSARETFRVHLNDLGDPNATPVPKEEYDRIRRVGTSAAV